MTLTAVRIAGLLGLAAGAALAGCSGGGPTTPAVTVTPGPSAGSPACARLITRLPSTLLGVGRSAAPARGSAGWGSIVLRCGVTPPGPSPDRCIRTDGIDWLFTEDAARYTFVTYGRTPAVEVTVPKTVERTRAPGAMTGLTAAVKPLPQTRRCD